MRGGTPFPPGYWHNPMDAIILGNYHNVAQPAYYTCVYSENPSSGSQVALYHTLCIHNTMLGSWVLISIHHLGTSKLQSQIIPYMGAYTCQLA